MKTHRPSWRRLAFLSPVCALALAAPPASASPRADAAPAPRLASASPRAHTSPDATPLPAMRWRMIGPFRAGRVLAAAGVPGNPRTFYFGAVGGGVWKTDNAGLTWTPIFDDEPIASVGALAIAESNASILYVGTGEADMRSDMTYGNGVYRSTDAGRTWTHVGLDDTRQIGRIVVDPKNPDIVLVAALGHAYGPNTERGVFRSTNGGRTWTKVLYRDENTGAIDLAMDPSNPRVVYAALWNARRPPWSQYPPNEGPGSGIYRSTDEGVTWTPVTGHGLPTGALGRIGLAVAPGGRRVYAIIQVQPRQGANPTVPSSGGSGLYRSDDGGQSWRLINDDARITTRMWYFSRVTVDPSNPDIVYLPNRGLVRSRDGGRTLSTIKSSPGGDDYHYLWVDPTDGTRMILGSDQGAAVSLDDGATWSSWYNQPTAQFYHVVTDKQFPYQVYGAQQDAGSVVIRSRSDYGEITFRDWISAGAGEAGYIAPEPMDPNIIFGGDTYGGVYRLDRRTGQRQTVSPAPAASFGTPMSQRRYRFTWTSPIVFDPRAPNTLYLGAQLVLKTTDGGLHWDSASPDLTGMKPGAKQTGPLTVANAAARGHGVVYTIAPSPVQQGVIWAGTDDGRIQRTTDGGAHWTDVTPAGLKPWSKISLIEASPFDAATAYAAVDRHRLDDLTPYIYRTTDGGRSWTRITNGIPHGAFARAVRADPDRQGLLYAGTELGVYVSLDDGAHWQSLQLNMPTVPVRDLAIHGADLIAATHGRAFWILDDVSPLRQLTGGVASAAVHLFRPAPAYRLRRDNSNDTPLPPEQPHGENPPAGAIIDYHLARADAGPITLEILDSKGDVIRRISSADTAASPAQPPYFMDAWLPEFRPLGRGAGYHRYVWDLRYTTPPAAHYSYSISAIAGHGTVATPQGPLVSPGSYEVRLTVGGAQYTQPLVIRADPRVHVPAGVYSDELALELRIWHAMARAHALQQQVDGLHARLSALDRGRLDRRTTRQVNALQERLRALRPAGTGDAMGGLMTDLDGADREPTHAVRAAFTRLGHELAGEEATWRTVVEKTLPALNRRITGRGLGAVSPPSVRPRKIGS